jgi:hypothetical protein
VIERVSWLIFADTAGRDTYLISEPALVAFSVPNRIQYLMTQHTAHKGPGAAGRRLPHIGPGEHVPHGVHRSKEYSCACFDFLASAAAVG